MEMKVFECVSRHFKPFVQLWHDRLTFCRGGESKAWDEVPCETAQSEDTQSNIQFISLHHLHLHQGLSLVHLEGLLCTLRGDFSHTFPSFSARRKSIRAQEIWQDFSDFSGLSSPPRDIQKSDV